jgi:Transposase DDE domain
VCDNHRISRHKVFADLAQRGKTSMGWFFGFKLHLVVTVHTLAVRRRQEGADG